MNYVYTGGVYLPVPVSVPASARPGQVVSLKAAASWLVCKDVCIPETADLSLDLPVTAGPAALESAGGCGRRRVPWPPRPSRRASPHASSCPAIR